MVCPNCGATAKRGRVGGQLRFCVRVLETDAFRVFQQLSRKPGNAGWVIQSPGCIGVDWAAPTRLSAGASYCDRCRWMDIDCASLVLHRAPRRHAASIADLLISTNPLEMFKPENSGISCPNCAGEMSDGYVFTDLLFRADGEHPGVWGALWHWLMRTTEARASARCCRACGWIEVDCSTFVEPPPIPVFDRIEHRG